MDDNVDWNTFNAQLERTKNLTRPPSGLEPIDQPPPPPHDLSMDDQRLAKLESAIEGLRHSQTLIWGGVLGISALIIAIQLYTLSQVSGITGKLSEEFRNMRAESAAQTSAIANSITATKQQAPQVILVPSLQMQNPANTEK